MIHHDLRKAIEPAARRLSAWSAGDFAAGAELLAEVNKWSLAIKTKTLSYVIITHVQDLLEAQPPKLLEAVSAASLATILSPVFGRYVDCVPTSLLLGVGADAFREAGMFTMVKLCVRWMYLHASQSSQHPSSARWLTSFPLFTVSTRMVSRLLCEDYVLKFMEQIGARPAEFFCSPGDSDPAWQETRCAQEPTHRDFLAVATDVLRDPPVFPLHHCWMPQQCTEARGEGNYARIATYGCANKRVRLSFQASPRPGVPVAEYLGQFASDIEHRPLKRFLEVLGDDTPYEYIAPMVGLMLRRNLGLIYAWPVLLNPYIDMQLGVAFICGKGCHDVVLFCARLGITFGNDSGRPTPEPRVPDIGIRGPRQPLQPSVAQLQISDVYGVCREFLDDGFDYLIPRICHRAAKHPVCKEDRCVLQYAPECPYWHVNAHYGAQLLQQARISAGTQLTRRGQKNQSLEQVGAIPHRGQDGAPWYVRYLQVPRVRPGHYLDGAGDLAIGVLDLALHALPIFSAQVLTDTEARKLQGRGERMRIDSASGVFEGDAEILAQNASKAIECWSRLHTSIQD